MSKLEKQLAASVAYYAQRNLRAGRFDPDHVAEFRREKPMSEAIVKAENGRDYGALIESAVIQGDLSQLKPGERAEYYLKVCESIGVNPLTRPFAYIKTKEGAIKLYALRDCADQLRSKHRVTISIVSRDASDDVYVVTARAMMPDGRADESTGAVATKGLQGEALANALMKAETKAKRRVTLSICGLGWLDETEVETIPQYAQQLPKISPHGEVIDGASYGPVEMVDATIRDIEEAGSIDELKSFWKDSGMATVAGYERLHPEARRRVSAAYKRRERQLAKPARELDQAAAAATAQDDL